MQSGPTRMTRLLMAVIGVVIIVAGVAIYAESAYAAGANSSELSSLHSQVSSLTSVVNDQEGSISALQSSVQQSTTAVTRTTTVIETTGTGNNLSSGGSTTTVSQVLTSTTTTTITVISRTVLPVGEPDLVSLSGTLTIPSGNGSGVLTLDVANTGNDPVVGIVVQVPTGTDPNNDLCTTQCTLNVLYQGSVIATSNPIPVQDNAMGSVDTVQGVAGQTYSLSVSITYADGTTPPPLSLTLNAVT